MEATPPGAQRLRPLGLGELLDRAVTLCVRFFVPLAAVYAVSALAQGAFSLYTGAGFGNFWTDIAGDIRGHAAVAAPSPGGATAFSFLLILVVEPVVDGALIAITSSLYLGRPMSLGQAYGTALARAVPLVSLAAIFLFAMVAGVAFVALLVVFGAKFGSGFASLGGLVRSVAMAAGVLLGVAGIFAVALTAAAMLLAFRLSSIACVLEGASAFRAIALCVRRSFAKTRFRRTLLVAAANLAILLGCELVVSLGALALPFLRGGIFGSVFETVAFAAAGLLGNAFCCVSYYDFRIREEGYDLQLAASQLRLLSRDPSE